MTKTKRSRLGRNVRAKAKTTATNKQVVICDGCCSPIVDDEHEAIQCEGCCHKWYHRLCAGVSKFYYDKLAASPSPFVCWLCSDSLRNAVIQQLQQEIATMKKDFGTELQANRSEISKLKEENAALRDALDRSTEPTQASGNSNRSGLPSHRKKKSRQAVRHQQGRHSSYPISNASESPNVLTNGNAISESNCSTASSTRNHSVVSGSRKICGTLSSATPQAVSDTISSLTGVPDTTFTVKRKFKMVRRCADRTKLVRWWFVIRGSEDVLKQLEEKWNLMDTQVKWKLEPVYCFSVTIDQQTDTAQQAENEQSESPPSSATQSNPTPTVSALFPFYQFFFRNKFPKCPSQPVNASTHRTIQTCVFFLFCTTMPIVYSLKLMSCEPSLSYTSLI